MELIRKTRPEKMAIQCSLPRARPTTLPARWVVGRTENAVGARTNAKKIRPPIQRMSESSIRNRRKDMTEALYRYASETPDRESPSSSEERKDDGSNCIKASHPKSYPACYSNLLLPFFQGKVGPRRGRLFADLECPQPYRCPERCRGSHHTHHHREFHSLLGRKSWHFYTGTATFSTISCNT